MSATIQQETVTVSKNTAIELVAAIQAAAALVAIEDDRFDSEDRADAIGGIAERFRIALLGPSPVDDDEYATDATLVELEALTSELEAEMITGLMQRRVSGAEASARLEARDGRSAQLREHAKHVRAAVNMDVSFPTAAEMSELVRAEMNARIERRADDAN